MLYIQEGNGHYCHASEEVIVAEAHRICDARLNCGVQITSTEAATAAMAWLMRHHQVEVFACLFLNSNLQSLGFKVICSGTINVNTVHPREVVKEALQLNAAAVILSHNHPSGNPQPSIQDAELTERLITILEPLRIRVLDHLVVGYSQVTSLACLGLIP